MTTWLENKFIQGTSFSVVEGFTSSMVLKSEHQCAECKPIVVGLLNYLHQLKTFKLSLGLLFISKKGGTIFKTGTDFNFIRYNKYKNTRVWWLWVDVLSL